MGGDLRQTCEAFAISVRFADAHGATRITLDVMESSADRWRQIQHLGETRDFRRAGVRIELEIFLAPVELRASLCARNAIDSHGHEEAHVGLVGREA